MIKSIVLIFLSASSISYHSDRILEILMQSNSLWGVRTSIKVKLVPIGIGCTKGGFAGIAIKEEKTILINSYCNFSPHQSKMIMEHEVGHILNVPHSTNYYSIMYPYTDTTFRMILDSDLKRVDLRE